MKLTYPNYRVTFEDHPLNFKAERRYILVELENVERELAKRSQRSWLFFSYTPWGIYRRKDWEHYHHRLEAYRQELNDYELEIKKGLVPFKICVSNNSSRADTDIHVRIGVEHGVIDDKKLPPKRPDRMDGLTHMAEPPGKFAFFKGFARHSIRIRRDSLEATFSRLEPHDNADLVRRVLHLESSGKTTLRFEVSSRGLEKTKQGKITL